MRRVNSRMLVSGLGECDMREISILLICLTQIFASWQTQAGGLDIASLTGINGATDHAADRAQELIDRVRDIASALEQQLDNDARKRLEDLDKIIGDATEDINKLEHKTAKDVDMILDNFILALEALVNSAQAKLSELIDKSECAGHRVVQQSLGGELSRLPVGGPTITIVPPMMYADECVKNSLYTSCAPLVKEFTVYPYQHYLTYDNIVDYLEHQRLNSRARNDTPIISFIETYNTLANFAKMASCFVPTDKDKYLNDYVMYVNKGNVWKLLFGLKIGRKQ